MLGRHRELAAQHGHQADRIVAQAREHGQQRERHVHEPDQAAQTYVFNASVVPQGYLGYLTLWPDGTTQPLVSTLNALDGSISSNMAIVPSTNGKVDAYASGLTQLILDISSYFAP